MARFTLSDEPKPQTFRAGKGPGDIEPTFSIACDLKEPPVLKEVVEVALHRRMHSGLRPCSTSVLKSGAGPGMLGLSLGSPG